jgi:hypothetical protein
VISWTRISKCAWETSASHRLSRAAQKAPPLRVSDKLLRAPHLLTRSCEGASLTYASPEVLAGAKATMASDVYSFGESVLRQGRALAIAVRVPVHRPRPVREFPAVA